MVLGGGSGDLSRLTRRHGVKVGARSLYTVEEVALAVGEVIGHGSVKSAARMNGAVVVFVEKVEQVNRLVEAGISVGGRFETVLPLSLPATKVTLSNVPPFITDEFLCRELSRHGKIVSPMRKVMSGCKSPLLKHVVSHRRQVYMILNNRDEDLNVCFKVRVDDFDYILFASSAHMKCFGCGEAGHLIKMCPNAAKSAASGSGERPGAAAAEPRTAEPRTAEPGAVSERPVAGAEGPEDDGAMTPWVVTETQVGEVGEEEELGCSGAAEAVELMEQEAVGSPAPSRLRSSNRPGPVKAKKSRQTGRQAGGKKEEPDSSDSEGCVSDDGDLHQKNLGSLTWRRDGLKYLGVYLGNERMVEKNWENVVEKVEERLKKWKWVHSEMSFRGRVLVINNLVASLLWHRLACLEPPPGLLSQIQAKLVNFFWGGYHWVPQSVLFLSRDQGGQGLIHLASRTATFRLWFVQRYLTGPPDLVWKDVASCLLRRVSNLGLDAALFLTDFKSLNLRGLPAFYRSVFKSCALFKWKRIREPSSLHWLLKEPLVHGGRLDVCSSAIPGLMVALCGSRTVTLKQLVEAAGPALADARTLSAVLGLRSLRVVERTLELWRRRLSVRERSLLRRYGGGRAESDPTDIFPDFQLNPGCEELSGPLLKALCKDKLGLHGTNNKTLYVNIVKTIIGQGLLNRAASVWTDRLGEHRPQWRVLYKPPIKKRTGDLQWRILHGAVVLNVYLSRLDPAVSDQCPFCPGRETNDSCTF
ncbi:Transposon TX1 uncharacterized 82 kDa protein ORF 1 [Takifugu flavidus]|uniref:Transposon TX1 uncharacterized 82 kDa protein ORF 1 n=1 Tax=Takifugu flavidus TaxID=433684 RepID=A0A5C6MLH6_9TELE|nr:Transposon TX1 uncharacterized 82 kDa protein ORF 1 [Takifugu flavidus]